MSADAKAWAEAQAQDCPRGAAAHVLQLVASFVDARGIGWAAVTELSRRANVSERQVQRCLRQLVEAGLLINTGRFTKQYGQNYPLYRIPIERGFATLAARREVERLQKAAGKAAGGGDMGVTTSAGGGDMGVTGGGDMGVTPGGDMGVTQASLSPTEPHDAGARAKQAASDGEGCDPAFRRVAAKWPEDRFDGPKAWRAWQAAVERVDPEELARAALGYLSTSGEVKRGFCKTLNRWLEGFAFRSRMGGLFEAGGEAAAGSAAARARFPDEAIRALVAGPLGEPWVVSYLDPARLNGRTITPHTDYARGMLLKHPALWKRLNLTIAPAAGAGREGELVSAVASGAGGQR
jgi:hypothetical protein